MLSLQKAQFTSITWVASPSLNFCTYCQPLRGSGSCLSSTRSVGPPTHTEAGRDLAVDAHERMNGAGFYPSGGYDGTGDETVDRRPGKRRLPGHGLCSPNTLRYALSYEQGNCEIFALSLPAALQLPALVPYANRP